LKWVLWLVISLVILTSNVDDPDVFDSILATLKVIQDNMPIIFPLHPQTRNRIASTSLAGQFKAMPNLRPVDPVSYLDFLKLLASARLVLTDSRGIQEETTILKVPCLTLRENTERPVTCEIGTNRLVGVGTENILAAYREFNSGEPESSMVPPLWDGQAARRIVTVLLANNG